MSETITVEPVIPTVGDDEIGYYGVIVAPDKRILFIRTNKPTNKE